MDLDYRIACITRNLVDENLEIQFSSAVRGSLDTRIWMRTTGQLWDTIIDVKAAIQVGTP